MVVINDAAVGTNGNINSRFLEIFVTSRSNLDNRCGLSPSDALLLTGDTDGTAADAYFYKVGAHLCKIAEALAVNNISCADFHAVAVFFANPTDCVRLPLTVALRAVDTKHVNSRFNQRRDSFLVVPGIYPCPHNISLMLIQKLVWIVLVGVVVLAKDKVSEPLIFVDNRQGVQLIVPKNVVCFTEGNARLAVNQLVKGRHKLADGSVHFHSGNPIVPAGYKSEDFALCSAVVGDCNGAVTFESL